MNENQRQSNENMASTTFGVFWGIILAVIVIFVVIPFASCVGCAAIYATAGVSHSLSSP